MIKKAKFFLFSEESKCKKLICKGKRPPKSIFNSKDDGWFDMGGSGERYIRITAEIYEEEIFVFYVDDPEAFVEALRDYMVNAGAGKIWGA